MAEDPPMVLRLRLLSDQPVEGCEIMPDVFLSNGASPTFANLDFRWYRCLDKMACTWCGKTPVVLQRLTDGAYFCSTGCFAAAWPGHPAQHSTGLAQRGPRHEGAENWSFFLFLLDLFCRPLRLYLFFFLLVLPVKHAH